MDHADKKYLKQESSMNLTHELIAIALSAIIFGYFGYQIIDSFK